MFKPVKVDHFTRKINSMYVAPIVLNQGAFVDIDPSDTTAIGSSYGYSALRAGSLMLATINSGSAVARELGIAVVNVTPSGPSVIQRMLGLSTAYMDIPVGLNCPVFVPEPGDIFATSEYVGNYASDSSLTGYIDITQTANYAAACEVYQGRLRLKQTGNPVRYEFLGKTTASGATVALFRCL